jgi:hypothetical protein
VAAKPPPTALVVASSAALREGATAKLLERGLRVVLVSEPGSRARPVSKNLMVLAASLSSSQAAAQISEADFVKTADIQFVVLEAAPPSSQTDGSEAWPNSVSDRLGAIFQLAVTVGRRMAKRGRGRIVLVDIDDAASPDDTAAAVLRAGLITMTHGLAKALAPDVSVAAVVSGEVEQARPTGASARAVPASDDVAATIDWLLSSDAWATGTTMTIRGNASTTPIPIE